MAEAPKKKMHPLGCLAIFLVLGGIVLGIGMLLGNREDAKRTPCERYAKTVSEALRNCHSGVNTSHRYQVAVCKEQNVNATSECLEAIRQVGKTDCPALERNPAQAAGDVCLK